jgi:hypothetical protein
LNRQLFTIEISGQGILTFDAEDRETAERLASSPQFQSHLLSYETVRGQVWDREQRICVREAFPGEIDTWGAVFRADGEPERRCLVWLCPVTNTNSRRNPTEVKRKRDSYPTFR